MFKHRKLFSWADVLRTSMCNKVCRSMQQTRNSSGKGEAFAKGYSVSRASVQNHSLCKSSSCSAGQWAYLFAMVELGSGNATLGVLCKGEVGVEGSRLVGVLPIP